jgi:hypothetical protein
VSNGCKASNALTIFYNTKLKQEGQEPWQHVWIPQYTLGQNFVLINVGGGGGEGGCHRGKIKIKQSWWHAHN